MSAVKSSKVGSSAKRPICLIQGSAWGVSRSIVTSSPWVSWCSRAERSELKNEIDGELKTRLEKYGIRIDDVSLVNIAFSPEFAKSIEAKQIAEQEAKKADYVAQKAIKEAEAEVNRAKGNAEAQRLQRETLTPALLQKQAIEKWDGQFPTVMTGEGSLPMINIAPNSISRSR
ncbi:MAG: hypothetical protein HC860_17945 [Alkalinema sp. RU_4_3]|nr:hypothetical protein [Alkalinema sp. RU_4_3]